MQIFLPPLLLDAALKIDWYVFKKVSTVVPGSRFPLQGQIIQLAGLDCQRTTTCC